SWCAACCRQQAMSPTMPQMRSASRFATPRMAGSAAAWAPDLFFTAGIAAVSLLRSRRALARRQGASARSSGMAYVDGFVVPVPKNKVDAYREMARKSGEICKEYGALEVHEYI